MANHKQELPMVAILVVLSTRNMEILCSISYTSPLQSNISLFLLVSPEDFLNFSQSETRIAHGDHLFCPIRIKWRNFIEDLPVKICFIEVSKEKILSIWPTRTKNFKWKIVGNSLCNFCKLDEDYSHYFITCAFLKEFWTKFQNLMKGLGIETKITLKHIVLGYKIDDKNYLALNFLITVVGFSIYMYKLYYKCIYLNRKQSIFRGL